MAQERGFRPTVELLLAPELVAAAQANQVLTPSQLHVLRQQIEALRRINVQLRALKYRARTGAEPAAPRVPSGAGRGRGRGRKGDGGMIVLSSGGRGRGRGRGRGKRGREDESEEDDSIVARSSEEEEEEAEVAAGSGSSEEEGMLSDEYESADTSESEEDFSLPAVAQPRRTGRMRRPSSAASLLADALQDEVEEEASSSSSGEDEVGQQQQRGAPEPAGPEEEEQGQEGAAPPARPDKGSKAAAAGSGGGKRRSLFMVVSEDTTGSGAAIHLPQLKPVQPPKRGSAAVKTEEGAEEEEQQLPRLQQPGQEEEEEEEVACDVCGDAEAVEGNVILLCEGKGCSVAVHQQCYGVHKVPAGKWLCEACKAKLKPRAANCCVCPVVGGAVKKVTSLGRVVPASSSGRGKGGGKGECGGKGEGGGRGAAPAPVFCHLACALWVPEIEFADSERMAGVRLDRMTAVRAKLRCEICKQAGGAAVQCAFGTCCRSFHVLCGRAAGQQLTFRATDGEPLAFCELHSRPAFEQMVEEYVDGKRPLELRGQPLDEGAGEAG